MLIPLVPGLLADLAADAPGVDLRISSVTPDLGRALAAGDPPLALAPAGFIDDSAIARPLGDLRFGVAARRGHPALGRPLTVARWLAHAHVVVRIGNERPNVTSDELARRGLVRRVSVEVASFLAVTSVSATARPISASIPRAAASSSPPSSAPRSACSASSSSPSRSC
ncbi:LysR substrate-binding domain-containing protein [Sorangium sp. So ce341]|uniref:LysR substrate-binding domain-containing protein n=1 Tax=Sorangium sp. So ce341 TaxID=3133302 RepID=UPI003F648077